MGEDDRKSSRKGHRSRSGDRDDAHHSSSRKNPRSKSGDRDDDTHHSSSRKGRSRSGDRDDFDDDRKARLTQQTEKEQDAKRRAKSELESGTAVGARTGKNSLGSSEHERRDREAKNRAKASLTGGTAVGATSSGKMSSEASDQERRDRDAKARARGNVTKSTVGAFNESNDRDVATNKRRQANPDSHQASSRVSKGGLTNSGNIRPGVWNDRSRPSEEKLRALEQFQSSSPPPPSSNRTTSNTINAEVSHDNSVMPVEATPIQDTEDEDRDRLLNLEIQNGEMRMQMQRVFDEQQEEEEERIEQQSLVKRHQKKIIAAVVAVVIIVGGVIGYVVSRPAKVPDTAITLVAVTGSPTTSPPTESPSMPPTLFSYPKPSPSDCSAIRTQSGINGQESMETKSYGLTFDVELTSQDLINTDWYDQLLIGLRNYFVPNLACCDESTSRRKLGPLQIRSKVSEARRLNDQIRCVVANAEVSSTSQDSWTSCGTACLLVSTNLKLYLKGKEDTRQVFGLIDAVITGYETIDTIVELDLNPAVFRTVVAKDLYLTPF